MSLALALFQNITDARAKCTQTLIPAIRSEPNCLQHLNDRRDRRNETLTLVFVVGSFFDVVGCLRRGWSWLDSGHTHWDRAGKPLQRFLTDLAGGRVCCQDVGRRRLRRGSRTVDVDRDHAVLLSVGVRDTLLRETLWYLEQRRRRRTSALPASEVVNGDKLELERAVVLVEGSRQRQLAAAEAAAGSFGCGVEHLRLSSSKFFPGPQWRWWGLTVRRQWTWLRLGLNRWR